MRVLAFLAFLLASFAANAQGAFRAYLASYGADTNPCTVDAPCRLLPAALNAVTFGGEIWILDSANFNAGTVDIGKSVSIMAVPGQIASIVAVNNAPALTVTAPGLRVVLRNLVITKNALNPGTYGLLITSNDNVIVEDSVFSSLQQAAIYIHDSTGTLDVRNTSFRFISNATIVAFNGPVVSVEGSHVTNSAGLLSNTDAPNTTTRLTLTDTTIDQAVGYAVGATSNNATGIAYAHLDRCTVHHSGFATYAVSNVAGGTATIYVGSSTLTDGTYAFYASGTGASIVTLGNNDVSSMTVPVTGTVAAVSTR